MVGRGGWGVCAKLRSSYGITHGLHDPCPLLALILSGCSSGARGSVPLELLGSINLAVVLTLGSWCSLSSPFATPLHLYMSTSPTPYASLAAHARRARAAHTCMFRLSCPG